MVGEKQQRIDSYLVEKGYARSRAHACRLIRENRVLAQSCKVTKPSQKIAPTTSVHVIGDTSDDYVGRGAYKLAGAIDHLRSQGHLINIRHKICLDAGASTGGFTDVLLREGARHVYAVDVGSGQLVDKLANNPRVTSMEHVNVRYLDTDSFERCPEIVVGDLSFISLTLVIKALTQASCSQAVLLLLVKPQFECDNVGSSGVVRDPSMHMAALRRVTTTALENGLSLLAAVASPLAGKEGNREFFLLFHKKARIQSTQQARVGKSEALPHTVELLLETCLHGTATPYSTRQEKTGRTGT
ncbi:MAG: TlyA family RNA methyltransferase [Actinomycetaceae bacterium]|nr:TlyA family RNA methyltransferase [Actinomycetaceae bacterium]